MRTKILALAGLIMVLGAVSGVAAPASLYETFSRKGSVAVYLGDFTDSTGLGKIDPADLKARLDKALTNRRSLTFRIVPDRSAADIAIDADVRGWVWLREDPVDMIMGAGATAMDALIKENYAAMETVFTVTDVKKGVVLWSDKVKATVTKKDMPEEASLSLVNEDMAKVFVRECFGKKRRSG